MRVDKREFVHVVCMRVFSTLMSWSKEKSCMRVDKSEFMRVFLTLIDHKVK